MKEVFLKRKNVQLLFILGIFLFMAIIRLIFPELDHGDEFADANVLNAGENFLKFGFIKCRFLPFFEPDLEVPGDAYLHFPPLPEIINGLLRKLFRTDSLYLFRGISLFFSFLGVVFWYLFIRKITGSYMISFLYSLFYLTNPFFIFGMDSLQETPNSEFLRAFGFFIFLKTLDFLPRTSQRRKFLFLLWMILVFESLVTFEYIIYFSLFFVLFKIFFKNLETNLSKKEIFILILAPVFGFLLHFLQNAWYFKSFFLALQDFKNIALERAFYSKDAPPLNFNLWWRYVILRNFSLIFIFDYPMLFLMGFFSCILYLHLPTDRKEEIRLLFKLFVIFIICGITWYIVFPSHSWAHAFVHFLVRHLLPASSIGFSIFAYITFLFIKKSVSLFLRLYWVIIIIIIIFTGIFKSELPITAEKIRASKEFIKFKNCLLKLKDISKEKDIVGVNYFRYPFMRYYTSRRFMVIFDKDSIESLPQKPKYFIFIPYNNPQSYELFRFIEKNYKVLFECKSERFPSIFFEFKE